MKTEKMMRKNNLEKTNQAGQQLTEDHLKAFSVKTPFQKNQVSIPFQGYNYFGSKPKWDE